MNRDLLIWCAGLWDGEGTFTLRAHNDRIERGHMEAAASMTMTSEPTIRRAHMILGMLGTVGPSRAQNEKHKEAWRLQACGSDAIQIARKLLPHLFLKLPQARLVIEFDELPIVREGNRLSLDTVATRIVIFEEMTELNKRGA